MGKMDPPIDRRADSVTLQKLRTGYVRGVGAVLISLIE